MTSGLYSRELAERLATMGSNEKRSFNWLIKRAVEMYLDDYESKGAEAA